jgi:hypothetical protein
MSAICPLRNALISAGFSEQQIAMEPDYTALHKTVVRLSAEIQLLKAQQSSGYQQSNPWLPLKDAATRLNFPSARALRNRIKTGRFPPDCYRIDPTATGGVVRYLIHVERYIKKLL